MTTWLCGSLSCVLDSRAAADEERPIEAAAVKLGRPVEFDRDIAPILRANCVACHNKGKSEGDLNLESSQTIMKGGSSGALIVPGKPDESYLYQVASRTEESFMPPWPNEVQAKKLTPDQVGLLKQWILEGAKAGAASTSANMQWQTINNGLQAVYAVDIDSFGRFVAAGRAGSVDVYDLLARQNVSTLADPELQQLKSPSQTTHRDYVHDIAFHPNGQMLATSGFQVVKLWERDLYGKSPSIAEADTKKGLVTSSDGSIFAGIRDNGTVVGISPEVQELAKIDAAKSTLLTIGGAENKHLVVLDNDGIVRVVDRAGAVVAVSKAVEGKPVQAVLTADSIHVVLRLEDGTLRALGLNAAEKTLSVGEPVKSDKGVIQDIGLAGQTVMCRLEGNAVELRAVDTLKPTVTIQSGTPNIAAAISSNAERVTTVSPDGVVELWNAKDGKVLATLNKNLATVRTLASRTADKAVRDALVKVVQGRVAEDEKRVKEQQDSLKKAEEELKKATDGVAEPKKKLVEATTKTAAAKKASEEKADDAALKKALEAAQKAEQAAKDAVTAAENAVKSAEKGKRLSEQAIKRAEAKVAERKKDLVGVEAEAKQSEERRVAADAGAKGTVAGGLATFVGGDFVVTIDTNAMDDLAGSGKAGFAIRLWNATDGQPIDVCGMIPKETPPQEVLGAAQQIAVRHGESKYLLVDLFPAWKLTRKLGPQGGDKPSVFADRVLSLAFSPDGTILAAGGGEASRSGELTLWNVADGKLIRTIEDAHSDTVYGVDFSSDGKLLASAAADKFVKVFDVATGKHVRSYEGHTHHVMDVSWKGDGTALASAGADNAIKVWNAETGEQSRTITTYKKQVTSLSFIGMEDEFISCSGDKRVFRHRAANGGAVREFKGCPDYVYCSATTADGSIVAAGCEDGILRIWNGKDAKEIVTFAPKK